MPIIISENIRAKLLGEHGVSEKEVHECFQNRSGDVFSDNREEHLTDPPTMWFLAETNHCRVLKVCYVQRGNKIFVKTAYDANASAISLYEQLNHGC